MKKIWFTSDLHLYHKKMALARGFDSSEHFIEYLVPKWNELISKSDTVYMLGDFGFNSPELRKTRWRLNGKIHLIIGNHDEKNKTVLNNNLFSSMSHIKEININKQPIIMCHYQMRVWNKSHYNSWHLFGHTHTGLNSSRFYTNTGKSLDVGLDNWLLMPVEYDEISSHLKDAPNNFNYIGSQHAKTKKD